ncbi:MAG: hypothetical protein IJ333_08975 [Clostridia bacterium]|nr:hypothetical protein [Clostridia bacterium]
METGTFSSKIKNFWYYHKWHLLVVVFLICALAVAIRSCQNKVNPDLYVLYAKEEIHNPLQAQDLETWFGAMTEDVNGDGETTASVLATSNQNPDGSNTAVSMLVQVNSGNAVLYLLTEETYGILHENDVLMDLSPVAGESAYVDGDRYRLSESGVLKELDSFEADDTAYYLAIRKVDGTSIEGSEEHQLQLRLAKDVLAQLVEKE